MVEVDPVAGLDREWEWLARGPLVERLRVWRAQVPMLAPFGDPAALIGFQRRPGRWQEKDAVLGALLVLARDDSLAGRLLLEALLPGLKRVAGRLILDSSDRDELWQLLLAAIWEQLRGGYPLARRPSRIAANLLLETRRQALAELARERRPLQADGPVGAPDPLGADGDVDALLARAVAAGAATADEAELILATRIDGTPLAGLAAIAGVRENTLYVRRLRAERRLRLYLGCPDVKKAGSKLHCFSARADGEGLAGSAGGGAAPNHFLT